ncbi:hypothetical protein QA089_004345 [Meyerozyma guilliermondii]
MCAIDSAINSPKILTQPPKQKKTADVTILKLKRAKTTYILTLPLAPTKSTYNLIKESLVHIINESGGLKPEDEGDDTAQDEEMIKDEEDIEIPKSEFTDELGEKPETGINVEIDGLSIALPKDKSAPYDNNWIEVDEGTLAGVTFTDYDIVAFKYVDDPDFQVVEAAYEEQE